MAVLIDGNNLLHAAGAGELEIRASRLGLCHVIGEWAKKRKQRVRIVFDGPSPRDAVLQQMVRTGVEVTFSGAGVSADVVLAELIRTESAPKRLTVVSSDREVQRPARRRKCSVESSDAFARNVAAELRRPASRDESRPEKPTGVSEAELKLWLEAFAVDRESESPDEGTAMD